MTCILRTAKEKKKWESFKKKCLVDKKNGIFKDTISLGNCSVGLSNLEGKLCLEIIPKEAANPKEPVEGVIVIINEEKCHADSIMKMAENARLVKKRQENRK